jgi:hypothetical protein
MPFFFGKREAARHDVAAAILTTTRTWEQTLVVDGGGRLANMGEWAFVDTTTTVLVEQQQRDKVLPGFLRVQTDR